MKRLTRRRLLETVGAAGAGAAFARLPATAFGAAAPRHQPGIASTPPAHLRFAAYDVTAANVGELRELMRDWSAEATHLRKQHDVTVTFGFGPGLFAPGRYGLESRRPPALAPLPPFPGDALDPALCGGDLAVQVCADDEGAAAKAVRRFAGATPRWSISGVTGTRGTPRNRMGFKDGTNNVAGDDASAMRHSVWVGRHDDPAWLRGGTYLIARRIRMKLDDWNATPTGRQERIIGRHKRSGAPLGQKHEFDQADFDGRAIPADAHIRLASPHANNGKMLRRRSYNIDQGLFFIAFARHPRQFVAIQRHLTEHHDALAPFIVHEGSALFACPPAACRNGFVGDALLVR